MRSEASVRNLRRLTVAAIVAIASVGLLPAERAGESRVAEAAITPAAVVSSGIELTAIPLPPLESLSAAVAQPQVNYPEAQYANDDEGEVSELEESLAAVATIDLIEIPEPVIRPDCTQVACLAITFDDGPSYFTDEILEALANAEAAATFFLVGRFVNTFPDEARRIADAGHEIGLHSHTHPRMTSLGEGSIKREFRLSRQAIREHTGVEAQLYRPPFGLHSARVGRIAKAPVIMWDVDPQDWRVRSQRVIYERVLSRVQPGSIVLLHELEETASALPALLSALAERGFHFVTVSELLGADLDSGKSYSRGPAPEQTSAD